MNNIVQHNINSMEKNHFAGNNHYDKDRQLTNDIGNLNDILPQLLNYFKSQEEYISMLEMSVQLLQREVDNLRNSIKLQDMTFDLNKKTIKVFNKFFNELNSCSNTDKIAKKLHQMISGYYPIIESNLFLISPDKTIVPASDNDTHLIELILDKLLEKDILQKILDSKIPTLIEEINISENNFFNAIILPIVLRNVNIAVFISVNDEKVVNLGHEEVEKLSLIAYSAAIVIDNIKSIEEISQMNQKLNLLNNEIFQSNKYASIGELSSMILQEIQSPLKVIMGNFKLLENGVGNRKRRMQIVREHLDKVQKIIEKLSSLTLYSSIESKPEIIDICSLIDEILLFSSSQLLRDGIIVDKHYSHRSLNTLGIKTQLEQVLLNIILNARDNLIDGGIIKVNVSKNQNNMITIKISDNGIGIAKNDLDCIFEPFRKIKNGSSKIGLGLYLAKSIIEQHQGNISVSSYVNKGNIYKIKLPYYEI